MNNPIFLVVAFGLTWGALMWYAWRLSRRIRTATSDLAVRGDDGAEPGS